MPSGVRARSGFWSLVDDRTDTISWVPSLAIGRLSIGITVDSEVNFMGGSDEKAGAPGKTGRDCRRRTDLAGRSAVFLRCPSGASGRR
jgi:hypothetical protein